MKRTENIQIKLSPDEKESILRNAERANTNTSMYLRTVGIAEGKVIFLDKGAYIPKNLIEVNDKITWALRNGKISDELGREIISLTKDVMIKFVEVTKQLTTINSDEGDE